MSTIAPTTTSTGARTVRAAEIVAAAAAAGGAPARGALAADTVFLGSPRKAGSMSVRERFATLEQRFQPEKAKGVDVRLQFRLSGSDGGDWYVEIKDGKCKVKQGTGPDPDVTLMASAKDYRKIADGEMNKMLAFLRGKLKIKGDRDKIENFDTWFRKP